MSSFKRDNIKWIRDKAKSKYKKGSNCDICGSKESLDFHHRYTLTVLFSKWCKDNKIIISSDEDVLAIRDRFIEEHLYELYEATTTLCHTHHMKLHSVYGKNPALSTAEKQLRWIAIQREKNGLPRMDSFKTQPVSAESK